MVSSERGRSIDFLSSQPALGVGILAGGAAMAFIFNISSYFVLFFTSALTANVLGNATKVHRPPQAMTDARKAARDCDAVRVTSLAKPPSRAPTLSRPPRVQVIIICISAITTANLDLDARNWVGVVTVCLSIGAYAYAQQLAKAHPPKPLAVPWLKSEARADAEAGRAGVTEGTPLKPEGGEGAATGTCCAIS